MGRAVQADQRYTITEAARLLDRSPHTLRSWDRNESMPESLKPERDENGHRYWTQELIDKIKVWIEENHFHPGRGIAYSPTAEQLQKHMENIRSAAGERSHVSHDEAALRNMVGEALDMGIAPEKIIESLPTVAAKLDHIGLGEAARIAGEVIDSR